MKKLNISLLILSMVLLTLSCGKTDPLSADCSKYGSGTIQIQANSGSEIPEEDKELAKIKLTRAILDDSKSCVIQIAKKHQISMDPKVENPQPQPFLVIASIFDRKNSFEALMELGAEIDQSSKTNNNQTALMWAAGFGQHKVVERLLKRGANVNHQGKNGHSAIMVVGISAAHSVEKNDKQRKDTEKIYMSKFNMEGLVIPGEPNYVKTAQLLINHGADLTLKNIVGEHVLDIIKRVKHETENPSSVLGGVIVFGGGGQISTFQNDPPPIIPKPNPQLEEVVAIINKAVQSLMEESGN